MPHRINIEMLEADLLRFEALTADNMENQELAVVILQVGIAVCERLENIERQLKKGDNLTACWVPHRAQ